jgi:hypothetical protein
MAKFPYGIADFDKLRQRGMFYADRTGLIPELEEAGDGLIFLRPRRFGKSLLVSMLANYYDVLTAKDFDTLFGDLRIGQQPTSLHNQYFILRWDFSRVQADSDPRVIQHNLAAHINSSIERFYEKYANMVSPRPLNPVNAVSSFENLLTAIYSSDHQLYVFIDEYDNFANTVAMSRIPASRDRYNDLLIGEGSLRTLFATLKSAAGEGQLDRYFVTGVAPMVLSDISSGFNSGENVSFDSQFADLCGFTEDEVRQELLELTPDPDALLAQMRLLYDGYSFDRQEQHPHLYHPTLALYFLKHLQRQGYPPDQPLDTNLNMDADKISWFSQVLGGSQLLESLSNDAQPLTIPGFTTSFRLEHLMSKQVTQDDLAVLVTYFGMATLAGVNEIGRTQLRIPNTVIRSLYIDELLQRVVPDVLQQQELKTAADHLYTTGDITPLCDLMEKRVLPIFSNRDYRHGEATVKSAFMTALFNDTQYLPVSEATLSRRYADAVFLVKPEFRQSPLKDILVEFKYIKLSEMKMETAALKALPQDELVAHPVVQSKLAQARQQRHDYTRSLLADYPDAHLHAYTVISIGFERLAWETDS